MRSRTDRLNKWFAEQTALSLGIAALGAVALAIGLVGTLAFLWSEGLTPSTELVETAVSQTQGAILWTSIALGAAALSGFVLYKRAPTKAAREATISGAALGVQAILFSLAFLVFRTGEKFPIFVRQFFSFEVLSEFRNQFVTGAKNTVILAAGGEAVGIVLGLIFSLLILSSRRVVRAPARAYINLFRGTPLLVQIMVGYFGIVLGLGLDITGSIVVIVILGLNAGAYTAEVFRAGIQSLERGQMEAARSLGMSYGKAMRYVVLPQAIRRVIPPLTNEFVILIKDTSLVFVIGLTFQQRELLAVGRDAFAETFNSTPFMAAAALYLVVTLPMIRLVTYLENRLRSGLVGVAA
ncbi:MAG TPA: amino acid ABC transporter permease [Actinomycetota bacterium]|nr:amino acid ABC transporter permease [Actinomycetota bacterium]